MRKYILSLLLAITLIAGMIPGLAVQTFAETNAEADISTDQTYSVSVKSYSHGTAMVDKKKAKEGESLTVTAQPDEGYTVAGLGMVSTDGSASYQGTQMDTDDGEISIDTNHLAVQSGALTYGLKMPAYDAQIVITFWKDSGSLVEQEPDSSKVTTLETHEVAHSASDIKVGESRSVLYVPYAEQRWGGSWNGWVFAPTQYYIGEVATEDPTVASVESTGVERYSNLWKGDLVNKSTYHPDYFIGHSYPCVKLKGLKPGETRLKIVLYWDNSGWKKQTIYHTITVTAQKYTITWNNADGTELGTDQVVEGETPSYNGQNPSLNEEKFLFVGWTPELVPVTKDTTYTATYIYLKDIIVKKGATVKSTCLFLPGNASGNITGWKTENADIATVDDIGQVTGVASGTTKLSARCGETDISCNVTVQTEDEESPVRIIKPDDKIDYIISADGNTDQVERRANEDAAKEDGCKVGPSYDVNLYYVLNANEQERQQLHQLNKSIWIEFQIPVDYRAPHRLYFFYRYHKDENTGTISVTKIDAKYAPLYGKAYDLWFNSWDGWPYNNSWDGRLYIFTDQFSTYTLAFQDDENYPVTATAFQINGQDNLTVGESATLTAEAIPIGAESTSVKWISDKPSVASVDQNGKVTAVSTGSAKITVEAENNPSIKGEFTVTVKEKEIQPSQSSGRRSGSSGRSRSSSKADSTKAQISNQTAQSSTSRADGSAASFSDVPASAYYAPAVNWAVSKHITYGTTKATFTPNRPVHRDEFVTFLWRLAGKPSASGTSKFADISGEGSEFRKAIDWAAKNGYVSGMTDSTFAPKATVTREMAATILYRYYKGRPSSSKSSFTDVAEGKWYTDAVNWGSASGIIKGKTDERFCGKDDTTRAQAVTLLYRAENRKTKV